MSGILIKNISFSYEDKAVFQQYSASIKEGEVTVLMSPSGSGKTTLLHLLAGLLKVQEGEIVYSNALGKPRFSMVFQDGRLVDNLSVIKNIRMVNTKVSEEEIINCLEELGVAQYSKKSVRGLSGGEKQRVAIARALLAEYDVLLLDEPFSGLDDESKHRAIACIKERSAGKTVLLVTHDRSEAALMGGSILSMP